MIEKLKTLKRVVIFIIMALVSVTAMIICFLLSFLDEKAYEDAWEVFFNNK